MAAVALIGLSNLIDVLGFSIHAVLRGREEMGPPARALALESAILVTAGTAVVLTFNAALIALSVVYVVAAIVAFIYVWRAARRRGIRHRRRVGSGALGWLFRVSVSTGIAAFFGAALARLDAVILALMTDDNRIVGLYGGAYRIFEATLFVSWAFGLAVLPILSRLGRRTSALRRAFEVSCMAISAVTIPLGGLMALYAPTIIRVFLGPGFAGGATAMRILGGATALYGVFTVASMILTSQDRQRLFPWLSGAAVAVNVGLNLALIPSQSLYGAATAMTAAQALATAMAVGFACRETGSVSPVRMFAAAGAGLVGMAAVALLAGPGFLSLAASLVTYAGVFLFVESRLHRDDLVLFVRAVRGLDPETGAREAPLEVVGTA